MIFLDLVVIFPWKKKRRREETCVQKEIDRLSATPINYYRDIYSMEVARETIHE